MPTYSSGGMIVMVNENTLKILAEQMGGGFGLVLVADGSGSSLGEPCGWCCLSYSPGGALKTLLGGGSCGTNNLAELEPFVQGLYEYHAGGGDPCRVLLVSDSEVTVRCGMRRYARRANGHLWAAVDYFESEGFSLEWRHVKRNSNPASSACDAAAGGARRLFLKAGA